MTSGHVTIIVVLVFIFAGGMFFIGKDHGRQAQTEEYASIVSEVVDILIRGTDTEE